MNFAFTEDQEALREQAREFLARHSASEDVRRAMESEAGYDAGLWKRLGAELGWTGLCVPEAYGGVGLGPIELTALMECMGGALLCAPFFSTQCLALPALLGAGSEAQKQEHLPALAEGSTTAALAFGGPDAVVSEYRAAPGGGFTLHGVERYVVDGHTADLLVIAARGANGIELFVLRGDAAGLQRRALPTMDLTRRLAELRFDGVRAERLGDAEGGAGAAALERAPDRARVALAAEQVGGAQRVLDLAVAYAKERVQFGRPIGSFQAIKHQCADMMLRVEAARSAA